MFPRRTAGRRPVGERLAKPFVRRHLRKGAKTVTGPRKEVIISTVAPLGLGSGIGCAVDFICSQFRRLSMNISALVLCSGRERRARSADGRLRRHALARACHCLVAWARGRGQARASVFLSNDEAPVNFLQCPWQPLAHCHRRRPVDHSSCSSPLLDLVPLALAGSATSASHFTPKSPPARARPEGAESKRTRIPAESLTDPAGRCIITLVKTSVVHVRHVQRPHCASASPAT